MDEKFELINRRNRVYHVMNEIAVTKAETFDDLAPLLKTLCDEMTDFVNAKLKQIK